MFIHLPPPTDDLIDNDAEETRPINVNNCEIVESVVKFASKTLHRQEEFEDIKAVIRIRKSKKNRQHNGKKKKHNGTTTIYKTYNKTKDRVTRTQLKIGSKRRCPGRLRSSSFTNDTRRVDLVTNPVISHERYPSNLRQSR